jgi:MinD-like ATPase involved in chromosome partitioning or flagellar assembly
VDHTETAAGAHDSGAIPRLRSLLGGRARGVATVPSRVDTVSGTVPELRPGTRPEAVSDVGPEVVPEVEVAGEQPEAFAGGTEALAAALRRDLGRARVVAFVNPKGGVHKTTATVLAAATLGTARGGGVIAWDDNELRGTLGLRAGTARHARTVRHLIAGLRAVEAAAWPGDELESYLRHAADGRFDVLAGDEDPRIAHHLDEDTVRRLLRVLTRSHQVVCVDTGNNVESENWRTVVRRADQLVVTTVPREDAAFTADWMLDLLADSGLGALAAEAVTVISAPTARRSALHDDLMSHFARRCRTVVSIPYDPELEAGSTIAYSAVNPRTRLAWLYASVAVTDRFGR